MHATQFIVFVGGRDERFGDELLASSTHPPHSLNTSLDHLKDENDIKEEAANDVRASVESFLRVLFDCLGDILDAREAAIVVMVVAMERAGVPNEGQGTSFCISVNSRRVSPRAVGREGSFDSVMLRGAPGKRTRRAANFAVNRRVVTTERVEYRKVMEGLMWLPVERQERVVASSQWHVSVRVANGSVLQGSPVLFVRDVAQGFVGRGFQEVSRGAVNLDAAIEARELLLSLRELLRRHILFQLVGWERSCLILQRGSALDESPFAFGEEV